MSSAHIEQMSHTSVSNSIKLICLIQCNELGSIELIRPLNSASLVLPNELNLFERFDFDKRPSPAGIKSIRM